MGKEIERKFLLVSNAYRTEGIAEHYLQGYLCLDAGRIVRIRKIGEKGIVTIKGMTEGISRAEYEYLIPADEALEMLETLCLKPLIEKIRYRVPFGNHVWEVDEFIGVNKGLVVAEIELSEADEHFEIPDWVGEEVSNDKRYSNSNLVKNPYSQWS
ncbi:MAG: CYTH domain-containing protein [Bacteroidota bacterium]